MNKKLVALFSFLTLISESCSFAFLETKNYKQAYGGEKLEYRILKPLLVYSFVKRKAIKTRFDCKRVLSDKIRCNNYFLNTHEICNGLEIRLKDCGNSNGFDRLEISCNEGTEQYIFHEAYNDSEELTLIYSRYNLVGGLVKYSFADAVGDEYLGWLGQRAKGLIGFIEDQELQFQISSFDQNN